MEHAAQKKLVTVNKRSTNIVYGHVSPLLCLYLNKCSVPKDICYVFKTKKGTTGSSHNAKMYCIKKNKTSVTDCGFLPACAASDDPAEQ